MQIVIDARREFAFEKIFSITLLERILRQLHELGRRDGVTVVVGDSTELKKYLRNDFKKRFSIKFDVVRTREQLEHVLSGCKKGVVALEGDGIYDDRVLEKLLSETRPAWYVNDAVNREPLAIRLSAEMTVALADSPISLKAFLEQQAASSSLERIPVQRMNSYIRDLRQRVVPFLTRLTSRAAIREIENDMYEKTFKGSMDFIATYIYRIPVRGLVRLFAPTVVTPNHITALSILCSFLAIPLFATGWLWTGLAVAFTFIICDSLDGKLARLTIRYSKFAGFIDTRTSTPFVSLYYLAWGWHLSGGDFATWPAKAALAMFVIVYLDKLVSSRFARTFHRSLFDFRPWDARFHLVAGRRTINLFIMTVGCSFQRPDVALYVMTAWMSVTLLWHASRSAVHRLRRKPTVKNRNLQTA